MIMSNESVLLISVLLISVLLISVLLISMSGHNDDIFGWMKIFFLPWTTCVSNLVSKASSDGRGLD